MNKLSNQRRQRASSTTSNAMMSMMSMMSMLALMAAHDVSRSVASSAGAGAILIVQAEAYTTRSPTSYAHASRSPKSNSCICLDGNQSLKPARRLRCGGMPNTISSRYRQHHDGTSLTMAKAEVGAEVRNNSGKYHLIWSTNFWKKMTISTILLCIAQFALKRSNVGGLDKMVMLSHSCHGGTTPINGVVRRVLSTVALPLLSSSCCAIQLMINAFSGLGCAGFNTYLGPIRPMLLPILLFSTWKLLPERSIGWTLLSLLLAFLPELLDIWNTNLSRRWQQRHGIDGSESMQSSADSMALALPMTAKLRLEIPTMGCVACVNKVDTSIRQCKSAGNIREETSWLTEGSAKGGMAELQISARTNEEIDGIAKEVVGAVKKAGFQCAVESLQVGNE